MQQSKVSVRGQTVIPHEIREKLHIKPNSKLSWSAQDGVIIVVPIPEDPLRASIGILKGSGYTFEDFIQDRQAERDLERKQEQRWLKQVAEPKRPYRRSP